MEVVFVVLFWMEVLPMVSGVVVLIWVSMLVEVIVVM